MSTQYVHNIIQNATHMGRPCTTFVAVDDEAARVIHNTLAGANLGAQVFSHSRRPTNAEFAAGTPPAKNGWVEEVKLATTNPVIVEKAFRTVSQLDADFIPPPLGKQTGYGSRGV